MTDQCHYTIHVYDIMNKNIYNSIWQYVKEYQLKQQDKKQITEIGKLLIDKYFKTNRAS